MAQAYIGLGYKNQAWFLANADLVLKEGQVVFKAGTTLFKIGDNATTLSNLEWSDKSLNDSFSDLQDQINTQSLQLTNHQTTFNTALENESQERFSADGQLQSNINAINDLVDSEAITRAQSDSDEAATREAADNDLQSQIDQEIIDRNQAIQSAVSELKDGVVPEGDTLQKLYNLILGASSEATVANIAARNGYNIPHIPFNIFVTDDGDGNWALYKATSTGIGANFVKLSDPDLLNAVMTANQIKAAYESNADTNAFTNALFSKLNAIAAGATANDTDANLKNRANHTGTQDASTITGSKTAAFISDFANAVLATLLTGIVFTASTAVTAADSILIAIGKLQAQITSLTTVVAGKIDHSLATAPNDFLVASGAGAFVKKTLPETKTVLGLAFGSTAGTYVEGNDSRMLKIGAPIDLYHQASSIALNGNYFFGGLWQVILSTTSQQRFRSESPITGTLHRIRVTQNLTPGTATAVLKVNNKTQGTSATLSSAFTFDSSVKTYTNIGLAVTEGDEIEIEMNIGSSGTLASSIQQHFQGWIKAN